ncbi:META domain-containing protein [Weeksella virosa]|uniref:DUF306 domain-containing protein n=1 Tax=Weeksella virosa (strain ATCC 43766 / DSM 16922 / JCM 21250 / CCUG 30538 / CDC 9751 / IAM 14551 / NBRC 16016 / NCTC 11634 / CL345/78) TaxID=865938 RepID=F0NXN4_WEEVC|nr:META domain-containing protein [Weeksella virosa]ADX66941.1 protein of unknown function DUF306 Meta and HslJ [Weeksella virosa DSM 16922]SUP53256.1 META domain [Weeksella virosa]VEH63330.1 META domain [Weeksella virosa]
MMKIKNLFYTSFLSGLFGLSSCTTTAPSTQNEASSTTNLSLFGTWTLSELPKVDLKKSFPAKTPSLTFEPITKKFTGNSGCNNMFGGFSTSQNGLEFTGVGMTRMFCEGVDENAFTSALDNVKTYSIKNETLILYNADKKEVMRLKKSR